MDAQSLSGARSCNKLLTRTTDWPSEYMFNQKWHSAVEIDGYPKDRHMFIAGLVGFSFAFVFTTMEMLMVGTLVTQHFEQFNDWLHDFPTAGIEL